MTQFVSEDTKEAEVEPVAPCPSTLERNLQRYAERNSVGALAQVARRSHHAGYGNLEQGGELL
jgi:hypothetical protein